MNLRNPWIDPRVAAITPEAAQDYLRDLGFRPVSSPNPDLLLFEKPEEDAENPVLAVPARTDEGAALQRMIDLVTDLARWQRRYAVEVLNDLLAQSGPGTPNGIGLACRSDERAGQTSR